MLHALGVGLRTEDVDGLVIRRAVSLQAFVALLSIVESRCHSVDAQEWRLDELGGGPFAGLDGVGGFDVAVHFMESMILFRRELPFAREFLPSRTLKPTLSQSNICVNTFATCMLRSRRMILGCHYTNGVDGRRRERGSHFGGVFNFLREVVRCQVTFSRRSEDIQWVEVECFVGGVIQPPKSAPQARGDDPEIVQSH